jgi:hypothetical protein
LQRPRPSPLEGRSHLRRRRADRRGGGRRPSGRTSAREGRTENRNPQGRANDGSRCLREFSHRDDRRFSGNQELSIANARLVNSVLKRGRGLLAPLRATENERRPADRRAVRAGSIGHSVGRSAQTLLRVVLRLSPRPSL